MALRARSIKIDDDVWTAWQAEARAAGVSLTALITARMKTARAAKPVDAVSQVRQPRVGVVKQAKRREVVAARSRLGSVPIGSVDVDPEPAPAPKPLTDADREYRRKLLTGAINPKKGKKGERP